MSIESQRDLEGLKAIGAIVAEVLRVLRAAVRPGISTGELDVLAAREFERRGAKSSPRVVYGFPGEVCISVNDEVVHGVPGQRQLEEGDLVKLDVTAQKNGYVADAAITVAVGYASARSRALAACAERAFRSAMQVARAGRRVCDIGAAVEDEVRRSGFTVLRDLTGHGVGRTIHEPPSVPNYFDPSATQPLTEGLVITVEPIISWGRNAILTGGDGWTVRTADRARAAHYEHTLVITKSEPILLTA
jgi:methionyl aminopeptidase